MPLLQWKHRYSVGIEAVDHEHRELIDLINTLHEMIIAKRDKPEVADRSSAISSKASRHILRLRNNSCASTATTN